VLLYFLKDKRDVFLELFNLKISILCNHKSFKNLNSRHNTRIKLGTIYFTHIDSVLLEGEVMKDH